MTAQPATPPKPKSESSTAAQSAAPQAAPEEPSRLEQARRIVRRNTYWAIGLGLVPFPLIDFLALTAVQVTMLKELSDLYHVKFLDDKAKTIIGSLVTGLGSVGLTGALASSLFKLVPVLGQVVGVVGVPVLGGTLTSAIGNLFVIHYESGGSLLNFDVEKMRTHFQQEYENAKGAHHAQKEDKGRTRDLSSP